MFIALHFRFFKFFTDQIEDSFEDARRFLEYHHDEGNISEVGIYDMDAKTLFIDELYCGNTPDDVNEDVMERLKKLNIIPEKFKRLPEA